MQRNYPEEPVTPGARDLGRPLGGGLTPVDVVIAVVKSDCPKDWVRYCELAQLLRPKQPTEDSQEEAGRQLLARNSKLLHQKDKSHLIRWGNNATPPTELEILAAEAKNLERQFRDRLLLALQDGRYILMAFHGLEQRIVPPALIKPGHFRFHSDEMEVNDSKLIGVHFGPAQAVHAPQNDPPGRKPGRPSAKDRFCGTALSILNDDAQRPAAGHGRKAELARLVGARLKGYPHRENTIAKMIRSTVNEWEKKHPDQ
jgi:hypothetical protein